MQYLVISEYENGDYAVVDLQSKVEQRHSLDELIFFQTSGNNVIGLKDKQVSRVYGSIEGYLNSIKAKSKVLNNVSLDLEIVDSQIVLKDIEGDIDNLRNFVLPAGVNVIGKVAFSAIYSLETVRLTASSLTRVCSQAFSACEGLKSVTLVNGLSIIDSQAFSYCTSLKEITLPDSVVELGEECFANCSKLEHVQFGNGLISIGSSAFVNCSSLKEVELPDSVTHIASRAFLNCSAISKLKLSENLLDIEKQVFSGTFALEFVILPKGLTSLDYRAFEASGISQIAIPEGVEVINSEAFMNCNFLTQISLPESLIFLGTGAFKNCVKLTSVHIDSEVSELKPGVFENCYALEDVYLSKNVAIINAVAFSGCRSLKRVVVANKNCKFPATGLIGIKDTYDTASHSEFTGCIYGYVKSTAAKYASEQGYAFQVLDSHLFKQLCDELRPRLHTLALGLGFLFYMTSWVGDMFLGGLFTDSKLDVVQIADMPDTSGVYDWCEYYLNKDYTSADGISSDTTSLMNSFMFSSSYVSSPLSEELYLSCIDASVDGIDKIQIAGYHPDSNALDLRVFYKPYEELQGFDIDKEGFDKLCDSYIENGTHTEEFEGALRDYMKEQFTENLKQSDTTLIYEYEMRETSKGSERVVNPSSLYLALIDKQNILSNLKLFEVEFPKTISSYLKEYK